MKKIILILTILILISSESYASNYILTNNDKKIVSLLSNKIQKILDKETLKYRSDLEKIINQIQKKKENDIRIYKILEEIKINTHLFTYENEYTNHYEEYNIDFQKIKNKWLSWHNKARSELGLNNYSYDKRLDNTSYEWSKKQEENGIMNHKRNIGDEFYNYKKIEKWFNNRGVKCKVIGGTTSSESVGKYGYYCKDNDCTDELLSSLKEIFDIYMNEKGLSYPYNAHYKGIVSPNLNKIGLGIKVKENFDETYLDYKSYDYYVTTHYCTKFEK